MLKEYKFIYLGRLPGLNEYLQAERQQYRRNGKMHSKGNDMKREHQMLVSNAIRSQLKRLRINGIIHIHYDFYEPNMKRDQDNVSAVARKFIQDALVECGVIQNDGWWNINGSSEMFYIDKHNPRIEVTLKEI